MTDYEYDEKLPYVVARHGKIARFNDEVWANWIAGGINGEVIDTTPKPRVPEDAMHVTWFDRNAEHRYARRVHAESAWWRMPGLNRDALLNELPGVTPDTVFTVLDERKQ